LSCRLLKGSERKIAPMTVSSPNVISKHVAASGIASGNWVVRTSDQDSIKCCASLLVPIPVGPATEVKGFDLSQEFDNLVERLEQIDYETISDALVLQLIALLLKRDCRRQVILTLGREEFIAAWPKAVDAIETAAEYLRNTYRIPVSRLLLYNALLVPFAYFFYRHKDKPDGDALKRLRDFFWRCSLGGRYSVSVESKLAQDIGRIDAILSGKAKPGIREQNLLMADIGRLKTARPVSFHGLLITIGPRDEGTAIAIGLVPSTGRVPPLDP